MLCYSAPRDCSYAQKSHSAGVLKWRGGGLVLFIVFTHPESSRVLTCTDPYQHMFTLTLLRARGKPMTSRQDLTCWISQTPTQTPPQTHVHVHTYVSSNTHTSVQISSSYQQFYLLTTESGHFSVHFPVEGSWGHVTSFETDEMLKVCVVKLCRPDVARQPGTGDKRQSRWEKLLICALSDQIHSSHNYCI